MKILMKEHTPHYLVHVSKTKYTDRYLAGFYFYTVHEVEPTNILISYKPYRAYAHAKIHYKNINLPYQYYVYKVSVSENVNNKNRRVYTGAPSVVFSPTPWESKSDELFRPWLSNIVDNYGLGSTFCYNYNSYYNLNAPVSEKENLLDMVSFDHLIANYDMFWSQCFNADAGGVKTKDKTKYTTAIVSQFDRIARLKQTELLDLESDWYRNIAISSPMNKSEIKALIS